MPDSTYHDKAHHRIETLQQSVKHLSEENKRLRTVTDEDVERVALALHDADPWLYGQDVDGENVYKPWDEAPVSVKDEYRKGARAALTTYLNA